MKLPSVQQILHEAVRTLRRFPLVLFSALVGTVSALVLIDYEGPPGPTTLFPILLASALGIPLLVGLALLAEKKRWSGLLSGIFHLVGILVLVLYGSTVPLELTSSPLVHLFRFFMLGVALLFFVAAAPFISRGEINGFWQYNKTLVLRLLTAVLFAGVLYAGLAIALAALNNLFGMEIPGKRYFELWTLIAGIFTTWFFLAGIPASLDALESATDYPKGLKIFAQYVLFPIVIVYLVILYAYMAKILIEWNWPKGWVSGLILGFSTAGILSLVLLHPLRGRPENRWIANSSRWFVVAMIPLVIMLLLAVWRRVSEYGITEGRYIVFALGLWLAVMVAYFILSKGKSIKFIPVSLCLLALFASFGPWGAFTVSERSQIGRLETILATSGILAGGKVHKTERAVSPETSREVSSILAYLHEVHGFGEIETWFAESLREDSAGTGSTFKAPAVVAGMMGIDYVALWQGGGGNQFTFNADRKSVLHVGGYDYLMRGLYIDDGRRERRPPGAPFAFRMNKGLDTMTVIATGRDSLEIDLRPLIDALVKQYGNSTVGEISPETMALEREGRGMRVKVYVFRIQLEKKGEKIVPTFCEADILCSVAPSAVQ